MRKLTLAVNAASILGLVGLGWVYFASPVAAQCTGVFPPNTLCGNLGLTPAPPAAFTATSSIFGPTTTTSPDIPYFKTNNGVQIGDSGVPLFSVVIYGADPTGVADSSTAVKNALAAANLAGGGTVYFPAGTYLITQQIIIPHDGTSPQPIQKQFRLTGQAGGSNWYATGRFPGGPSGAILNLTYSATTDCKICSVGLGGLLMDNLTLIDLGSDATPFFLSTNTTVTIRSNSFVGTNVASQNAIVLGGTSTGLSGATSAAFQGYGTSINNNTFSSVNAGILMQTFANGINIVGNGFIHMATNSTSAPIVSNGNVALPNLGLNVSGNTIEVTDSVYGIELSLTTNSTFHDNSFYDGGGAFISSFNLTNSVNNVILRGFDGSSAAGNFLTGDTSSLAATTFLGTIGTKDSATAGFASSEIAGNVVIKGLYDNTKTYRGQLTLRDTNLTSASYVQLSLNNSNGNGEIRSHGGVGNTSIILNPDAACGGASKVGIGNTVPAQCLDVGGTVNTSQYYLNNSAKPSISSCGTGSPSVGTGSNNQNGIFTTGNATNLCTITFANAYPNNAFCVAQAASAGVTSTSIGVANNSFTLSWAPATSGASFQYQCGGN